MTGLDRARRFIQQQTATTALVIVPLAVATPAAAAPIFDVGTASAMFTDGMSPAAASGFFSPLPDGGIRFVADYEFVVPPSSGGGFAVELTLAGTGSGVLDSATIPAFYDYLFVPGSGVSDFASSVSFFINGNPVGAGGPHGSAAVAAPLLSGWDVTDTLATWSVVLRADFTASGASSLLLDIDRIDIAPGGVAVPEPALAFLVTAGGGALWSRRRDRARRH